jgi:hypothetical protein
LTHGFWVRHHGSEFGRRNDLASGWVVAKHGVGLDHHVHHGGVVKGFVHHLLESEKSALVFFEWGSLGERVRYGKYSKF